MKNHFMSLGKLSNVDRQSYRTCGLAVVLFMLLHSLANGQNSAVFCPPESSSGVSTCGAMDAECFTQLGSTEILDLPIIYVELDFHFVKQNNNNFQCNNPTGADFAPTYVQQILSTANAYLAAPEQNALGAPPPPAIPDARIRFRLVGNPSDPCDAIFFYDAEPGTFSNSNAMHIVVTDNNSYDGQSSTGLDRIWLHNLHKQIFENNIPNVIRWGPILNHEFGHQRGLAHSFSAENTCPDMDAGQECGGPNLDQTSCTNNNNQTVICANIQPFTPLPANASADCFDCYCEPEAGNNFMGYNSSKRGMAPSQWGQMYGTLVTERPAFAKIDAFACTDVPAHQPLEIPANTVVEWNAFRLLNQHVEVRPGASLIVTCEVQVAKGLPIIVNRGARLFVIGGKITSQSPDCLWAGILVHGKASAEQPNIADAQDLTKSLDTAKAGVVWVNGSKIENAVTGISTRGSGSLGQDYYGGLVMVDGGSKFINNSRAAEFLRYSRINKSYFNFCDIVRSGVKPWSVNRGVSIWACHGIKFEETHFKSISNYGIYGENFTAEVIDCSFGSLTYGFRAENTMPNAAPLSSTYIRGCAFGPNNYDINGNAANKGKILDVQGNLSTAASNCFDNPQNAVVAAQATTEKFAYYILDEESPAYDPCYTPTNNLSDGGTNNYSISRGQLLANCTPPSSIPLITESDLTAARANSAAAFATWQADLENEQKKLDYFGAAKIQDVYLRTLMSEAVAAGNLVDAESLLLGENTQAARRGVVGLRTFHADYVGAQSLLDSMPVENQDDQWFKDIMAINFAVEQSTVYPYPLTEAQEQLLHTIAGAEWSLMRGYACALLSMLVGYTCTEIILGESPEGNDNNLTTNHPESSALKTLVFPNPTTGILHVECPQAMGEELVLDMLDFSGQVVKTIQFVNNGSVHLDNTNLSGGIYWLRLYTSKHIVHSTKIIILR